MKIAIAPRGLRLLAGSVLLLAAGLAHAQYVWVNEKGVKQFSDRPPPPSTPRSKILKAPGLQPDAIVPVGAAAVPAAVAPASVAKGPPTMAEREVDFRKRAKERAERNEKAAGEAQQALAQRDNCAAAREYKQQLESGVRIATTAQDGERGFLDDAERARRSVKVNKTLEGCR